MKWNDGRSKWNDGRNEWDAHDPIADFIQGQEPLGAEFEKVLHDNLDSLYETDVP